MGLAWDTMLQGAVNLMYCCAVCICYEINSGANQRHATATVLCFCALRRQQNQCTQMHWHCDFVPTKKAQIHTGFHHFMKMSQIFNK